MNHRLIVLFLFTVLIAGTGFGKDHKLKLGMTTSMDNAGITNLIEDSYDSLFSNTDLKIVVSGTGKVLSYLDTKDLHLAIVHNKERELLFLEEHPGERIEVFSNDFVIVGPKDDPANVAQANSVAEAIKLILDAEQIFISRGDDSGTHIAERNTWVGHGIDYSKSEYYLETGAGSGQSLNTAAAMGAYMFVDSSTFYLFQNKRDLVVLKEHDTPNIYSLIIPTSDLDEEALLQVIEFKDWLLSAPTREMFHSLDDSLIRYIAADE